MRLEVMPGGGFKAGLESELEVVIDMTQGANKVV